MRELLSMALILYNSKISHFSRNRTTWNVLGWESQLVHGALIMIVLSHETYSAGPKALDLGLAQYFDVIFHFLRRDLLIFRL